MAIPAQPVDPYAPPTDAGRHPPPAASAPQPTATSIGWPSLFLAIAASWAIAWFLPATSTWISALASTAPLALWFVARVALGSVNGPALWAPTASLWWILTAAPVVGTIASGFVFSNYEAYRAFDHFGGSEFFTLMTRYKFDDSYPFWIVDSAVYELVFRGAVLTPCVIRYGRGRGVALAVAAEFVAGGGVVVALMMSALYLRTRSLGLTLAAHLIGATAATAVTAWAVPHADRLTTPVFVIAGVFLVVALVASLLDIRRVAPWQAAAADG